MTYNIHMGGRNRSALDEVVSRADPHVLLVNESPRGPLLWKRRCRRLCGRWDMTFVTGGRPAGSNCIMVKPEIRVRSGRSLVLEQPRFQPRRGIAAAQLCVDSRLVGVVACHLSLDRARRLQEVEKVIEESSRLRGPVIVGGDLNERPDGPSWARLRQAGFVDPGGPQWKTFPADEPTARIDALLVRGDARIVHHGDPGVPSDLLTAASDHRPVLAVVEV